jgi:hypothetical protein
MPYANRHSLGLIPYHIRQYRANKYFIRLVSAEADEEDKFLEIINSLARETMSNCTVKYDDKLTLNRIIYHRNLIINCTKTLKPLLIKQIEENRNNKKFVEILNILLNDIEATESVQSQVRKEMNMALYGGESSSFISFENIVRYFNGVMNYYPQHLHPFVQMQNGELYGMCDGMVKTWPHAPDPDVILTKQEEGRASPRMPASRDTLLNKLMEMDFEEHNIYHLGLINLIDLNGHVIGIRKCNGINEFEVYEPNIGIIRFQHRKDMANFLHFHVTHKSRFKYGRFSITKYQETYSSPDKQAQYPESNSNANNTAKNTIIKKIIENLIEENIVFPYRVITMRNDLTSLNPGHDYASLIKLMDLYLRSSRPIYNPFTEHSLESVFFPDLDNDNKMYDFSNKIEKYDVSILEIIAKELITSRKSKVIIDEKDISDKGFNDIYHYVIQKFIPNKKIRDVFVNDANIEKIIFAYRYANEFGLESDPLLPLLFLVKQQSYETISLLFSNKEKLEAILFQFNKNIITVDMITSWSSSEKKSFTNILIEHVNLEEINWPAITTPHINEQIIIQDLQNEKSRSASISFWINQMQCGSHDTTILIVNTLIKPEIIKHLSNDHIAMLYINLPKSLIYQPRNTQLNTLTQVFSDGISRWSEIVKILKIQILTNLKNDKKPLTEGASRVLSANRGLFSIGETKTNTLLKQRNHHEMNTYYTI